MSQPHQTKCGKIAMQRRGWWFPSPQEESAVWPSGRRGRGQGSRGERFCEPSLSSASSRWSLLRIRRNKITPMLVFWVQHSESIFCSQRLPNIVPHPKDLHTQSTVHCTAQPGLTKGNRDLMVALHHTNRRERAWSKIGTYAPHRSEYHSI